MITIAYCTSRLNPKIEWFIDSIKRQLGNNDWPKIIMVDLHHGKIERNLPPHVTHTPPKPTIWQGTHRITKEDHWAVANSRNTALLMCQTEYILWVDDRCLPAPTWLAAAYEAAAGGYAVCGSYEKRHGITVENGALIECGTLNSEDCRNPYTKGNVTKCDGGWFFGGTLGMPVNWALQIGGFAEDYCDGMSFEDVICGIVLQNNGYLIKTDPRLKLIEDRTPGQCGPDMIRNDKGVSPKDKSHKVLEVMARAKTSMNSYDSRKVRESVLAGNPFPPSSHSGFDWYDNSPIAGL